MSTIAEYRARAAEAQEIARLMSRHDHREQALQLARDWLSRAEELERRGPTLSSEAPERREPAPRRQPPNSAAG